MMLDGNIAHGFHRTGQHPTKPSFARFVIALVGCDAFDTELGRGAR